MWGLIDAVGPLETRGTAMKVNLISSLHLNIPGPGRSVPVSAPAVRPLCPHVTPGFGPRDRQDRPLIPELRQHTFLHLHAVPVWLSGLAVSTQNITTSSTGQ